MMYLSGFIALMCDLIIVIFGLVNNLFYGSDIRIIELERSA
jgi:hypothetical protein